MADRLEINPREELSPHQLQLVETVLQDDAPTRVILLGPPGFGKTTALAAVITGINQEREAQARVLVLTPRALVEQWKVTLERASTECKAVDPPEYRRLQLRGARDANPWGSPGCYITTLSFISRPERLGEVLACPWDLVVLDEVHHLGGDRSEKLLTRFWNRSDVDRLIGAAVTEPEWLGEVQPAAHVVRWSRETLADRIPDRQVEKHTIPMTPSERTLSERVLQLSISRARRDSHAAAAAGVIVQRIASSLFAAEQSLRRMATTTADQWIPALEDADAWADPGEADTEVLHANELENLLDLFDQTERDSKLLYCEHLLSELVPTRSERQVVLFTDFLDSAHYLHGTLRDRGWETILLSSLASPKERLESLEESNPGTVIIATSAAVEGDSFAFVDQAVHYDVPNNPLRLAKRFGSIERLSNPHVIVTHHLLIDPIVSAAWAGQVVELTEKVERLEMGDWTDLRHWLLQTFDTDRPSHAP